MRRIAGCILGVAILGALACSDAEVTPPPSELGAATIDGTALFSEACSECHSLKAPISAAASILTPDEAWALVDACAKHGLSLTEDERAAIVEYLLERGEEWRVI